MSNRKQAIAAGAGLEVLTLSTLWAGWGFIALSLAIAAQMALVMLLVGLDVDNKEAWND